MRVDLQRLKAALESGRLTGRRRRHSDAPAVDAVVERDLTDDSPEVVRTQRNVVGQRRCRQLAAAILIGVAMSYYHLARPGADLPLQLPEGAVVTKARDTVEGFGYKDLGSRTGVTFVDRAR